MVSLVPTSCRHPGDRGTGGDKAELAFMAIGSFYRFNWALLHPSFACEGPHPAPQSVTSLEAGVFAAADR